MQQPLGLHSTLALRAVILNLEVMTPLATIYLQKYLQYDS